MIKRILAAAALTMAVTSISSGAMAASGESTDAPPKAGGTTEGVVAAASSPTVSPAAEKVVYRSLGVRDYACPSGRLCVDVWDPTRDTYKVFQFWQCQTHSLRAFYSTATPEFENKQTSGTVTRFKNSSGTTIKTSTAKHSERSIDWLPVYYIDVC